MDEKPTPDDKGLGTPSKVATTTVTLFVPSADRQSQPINQDAWVAQALDLVGRLFAGGTAYPKGRGVWRDDARGGQLVYDETVIVFSCTSQSAIEQHEAELFAFLFRMGKQTNQGAVGIALGGSYFEFAIPN